MTCHVSNQIAEHADKLGREDDEANALGEYVTEHWAEFLSEAIIAPSVANHFESWLWSNGDAEAIREPLILEIFRLAEPHFHKAVAEAKADAEIDQYEASRDDY